MTAHLRPIRLILLTLATFILFSACDNRTTQNSIWKTSEPGISYATITIEAEKASKDLIVVKIDPLLHSFTVYQNQDQKTAKTIEEIHNDTGAAITVNGSFFTENFQPTGLLITNGQQLSTFSKANLVNGIIAITKQGEIHFFNTSETNKENPINPEQYEFAIQNGPIILDKNGNIKTSASNPLTASRTIMGVDKDNNIVLILVKQSLFNIDNSLTLDELAHIIKETPELKTLNLHSVLNLDGGSSTGLKIDNKYFPEMEKVQNVVLIKKRTQ